MTQDLSEQELYLGLNNQGWDLIKGIFARHADMTGVILFGSRAKGIHSKESDIDFAIEGIDDPLEAERIANELEELPLTYNFDIWVLDKTCLRGMNGKSDY